MILSNAAIKNRTTVFVLMLLIIIAGSISYATIPRESAPEVKLPNVMITTIHEGVAPEDIENTITKEIEKELSGLKGLKEIQSVSAEGISRINVQFYSDVVIEDALQRVKDKVDLAKPEIPLEAEEPVVTEINIAEFPIMMVSLAGSISPVRLKDIADELEDYIESVPGVLEVDVLGALEREIRIELDPDRVAAYGLTSVEIMSMIPAENVNKSAGGLETPGTKFNVRVPAEFEKPEEFFTLPLTQRNGKIIYLRDVATISDTFKDRLTYSRLNGRDSITLAIKKRVGANIIDIADRVKAILAEARKQLPAGVELTLTQDRSDEIKMMVLDLENNVMSGLVLVVGVLLLFMGLRSSLIVGLAIPMSMLISFSVLQVLGVTLNMIVLFSLILALGMLVDNAIVIVENIYRHRQSGLSPIQAAMTGTGEVAWPVITSTATTVAAFVPLLFWPDVMGDFMSYLPLTVIITLISSLFVALVINPVFSSVLIRKVPVEDTRESRFVAAYRWLLQRALNHRFTVIALAVLLLVGTAIVYSRRSTGVELFPETDPQQAVISIRLPQGTNIRHTNEISRQVEKIVQQFRYDANGTEQIEHVVTNVGEAGGFSFFSAGGGPHVANLTILFPDYEVRIANNTPSWPIVKQLREAIHGIPGAEIKVERIKEGPPTGDPVSVRLIGEDLDKLARLSEDVKDRIRSVPNLVNLRSDLELARPELSFKVDRQRAYKLNVNTSIVADFLAAAVFGRKVSSFRDFNDEYDITVRLPESQRTSISDLFRWRIPSLTGKPVPLSSLGEFEYRPGLGTIHRYNQKRVVTVSADNEGRLPEEVLSDVEDRLSPLGPTRIYISDVTDWPALLNALTGKGPLADKPPISRFREMLTDQQRQAVAKAASAGELTGTLKTGVVDAINQRLTQGSGWLSEPLFRRQDVRQLELPPQGEAFIKAGLDTLAESERSRFNRIVLENALGDVLR
ncbi:MAG: efflux RND transporter permease subunit, partial [Phycisphaerae bacterium]